MAYWLVYQTMESYSRVGTYFSSFFSINGMIKITEMVSPELFMYNSA